MVTKSQKKWSSDLASSSEEIIHEEQKEARKSHSVEDLQRKTVNKMNEKEKKKSEARNEDWRQ